MSRFNLVLIIAAVMVAGCSGQPAPNATQVANLADQSVKATVAAQDTQTAALAAAAEPAATEPAATATPVPATATPVPATATSAPTDAPVPATPTPEATASAPAQTLITCSPTQEDMLGPFYVPDAPVRDNVGQGYVLSGVVRSAVDCLPLAGAQIEFWLAGPDGEYSDAFRATLFAGKEGAYRFSSHAPPPYSGRPPHIHLRVTAPGYQTLVTQHYPGQGATSATFDLVLSPTQ